MIELPPHFGYRMTMLTEPTTQFYAICWLLAIVISITLHELAHGWAAVRMGDDTPLHAGRLTGNPIVHMGPFSLIAMLFIGIAWGQMPIDPSRLRGRHAEALVAAAGPAANLILAIAALSLLGILGRFGVLVDDNQVAENATIFLWVMGSANLLLMLFNLLPIPPLDGSHILATYNRPYRDFFADPSKQGFALLAFIFAWMIFSPIVVPPVLTAATAYLDLLAG
ncbi:MAG: site-2 protease family protein [Phycisphaeraceae bacterium]